MVGSAISKQLSSLPGNQLVKLSHAELDLTNQPAVDDFFAQSNIDEVYLAAAKVGGIHANNTHPAEFIFENLMIESNIIHLAFKHGVKKLLFLGSSCIYPKLAEQPMREEALLTGPLEPTNEPYAIAKIAGIKLCESYNRQYGHSHGVDYRSVMPTNLYGPGDNYTEGASHVLPALIRRYSEAAKANKPFVVNWGTGTPLRELMYVEDLADATLFLMENYDGDSHINVGTGQDHSIRQIADLVAKAVGYEGETRWDQTKPDGTPKKVLDISRIESMGWAPKVALEEGIKRAVADFRNRFEV